MRTRPNDIPATVTIGDRTPAGAISPATSVGEEVSAQESERKCVLSGAHGSRTSLIRLALGPDNDVAPDIRARAPGRGAWIGVDRAALETAIAKGKLKGALSRAFKTQALSIPADLGERIETALQRDTLDRLGLEARAGHLVTGSDRIGEAARKGMVALLAHAEDAAEDGRRKLDQALRVGAVGRSTSTRSLEIPVGRAILSMALGRENVVHIALTAPAAAVRVSDSLARWRGFIGRNENADACEGTSQERIGTAIDVKGSVTNER